MISLKVYNGEQFERSKRRYLGFALVIIAILSLSLFYKSGQGVQGLIGAIILLMIVGGYLFFLAKTAIEIQLTLKPEGVFVGTRFIPISMFKGFVVEMEKNSGKMKNIVFVLERTVEIYTLKDSKEHQEIFFTELSKVIPFLEGYEQGSVDKLMRKLKL